MMGTSLDGWVISVRQESTRVRVPCEEKPQIGGMSIQNPQQRVIRPRLQVKSRLLLLSPM